MASRGVRIACSHKSHTFTELAHLLSFDQDQKVKISSSLKKIKICSLSEMSDDLGPTVIDMLTVWRREIVTTTNLNPFERLDPLLVLLSFSHISKSSSNTKKNILG
jgi:hypothetical protein